MADEADDDGDEIGIDTDMEPESPDGSDPGGGDDDYDDGDGDTPVQVAGGGPVSRVIKAPRAHRGISDATRKLFAEATAKIKAAGGLDSDLEPMEHEELEQEAATPVPGEKAEPVVATPSQPEVKAPPAEPEDVAELRRTLSSRTAELDAREAALRERDRSSDVARLREEYFDKGAPAIVEILKQWEGIEGDELKDAVADLVSDLSSSVLGVDIPQEMRDRLDVRRIKKLQRISKADKVREQEEATRRAESAQEEQNRVRVVGALNQEINKPEHKPAYQWLMAEANPGAIIVDVIDEAKKKDGTKLTWTEAAKRANDYLEKESKAWFDTRKHLLAADPGQGAGAKPKAQPQGDPSGKQVTQAPPSRAPKPPPTPQKPEKWDPESHRRAVKAKHRAAFTREEE